MAILNIKKTDFIVYSSFDNNFFMVEIDFDPEFAKEMLTALKNTYYKTMLHYICMKYETSELIANYLSKIK